MVEIPKHGREKTCHGVSMNGRFVRYVVVIRLQISLIGPVYLIGAWLGEDQRTSTIKMHV